MKEDCLLDDEFLVLSWRRDMKIRVGYVIESMDTGKEVLFSSRVHLPRVMCPPLSKWPFFPNNFGVWINACSANYNHGQSPIQLCALLLYFTKVKRAWSTVWYGTNLTSRRKHWSCQSTIFFVGEKRWEPAWRRGGVWGAPDGFWTWWMWSLGPGQHQWDQSSGGPSLWFADSQTSLKYILS